LERAKGRWSWLKQRGYGKKDPLAPAKRTGTAERETPLPKTERSRDRPARKKGGAGYKTIIPGRKNAFRIISGCAKGIVRAGRARNPAQISGNLRG